MQFNLEKYWSLKMSPEEKKQLERMKTLHVKSDVPEDLRIAIKTFIKQAVIIGEYDLDYMPSQYMASLLESFAKYPEYSIILLDMIKILEENELIER